MAAPLLKLAAANDGDADGRFSPRTIPEQLAEELGADIVAGRRKAGERLIELDLAQNFGVSRGPVREALRILERRRMVDLLPRRGAYVRPLSLKSIADLFNVRLALSLLAARTMATAPVESYVETLARRCGDSSHAGATPSRPRPRTSPQSFSEWITWLASSGSLRRVKPR